mgnify:CR=1 FL=1
MAGICSIEGCGKPAKGYGWCSAHYQRWRQHGDPLAGRASPVPAAVQDAFLRGIVAAGWPEQCVTWPFSRTEKGYGVATLDGVRIAAHRASCQLAHGEPPTPEHQAAHSCGKGHEGCINPGHLRWATPAENSADQLLHGTAPIGVANPAATLTEEQVLTIWSLRGQMTQEAISRQFGVPEPTVGDILRGASWASVTGAKHQPGRRHGSAHHAAKLAENHVREIRSSEDPIDVLARRFGVTKNAIRAVQTRRVWAWLDADRRVA